MLMRVQDISFSYAKKDTPAVSALDFEISAGEVIAVVGCSGCGKSTLGNLLTGVIPAVITDGRLQGDILKVKGTTVGLVSQSPENQLFGYSAEDAIVFGLENMCLSHDEITERLEDVLSLLNIAYLRERPIEKCSGGQKQSVCIASILAMRPDIIVMDEPVSSLDPAGKTLVSDIIGRLAAQQQTIVLLDQNLDWCRSIVTRVIGLESGRITFDGPTADFLADPALCSRLGVTLPPVTLVCHALQKRGLPVPTLSEWDNGLNALSVHPERAPKRGRSEGQPILEVQDLHHSFGDFEALRGVDVCFDRGLVTAILGQNGCGKTTLVKHLNGLLKPDSGRVLFEGEDIAALTTAALSAKISFCFQHPDQMLFEDSVEQEISFASRMHGLSLSRESILALLADYGLEAQIDEYPCNLSMGQKHMVTILAASAMDSAVYIFDEPTLGMDSLLKARLTELIRRLRGEGKTVLIISHELPFVCELADRIVIMKEGRVLGTDTAERVFANENLFEDTRIPLPEIRGIANRLGLPPEVLTSAELAHCLGEGGECDE